MYIITNCIKKPSVKHSHNDEVKWVEAIALAITQGKNVVKNPAELYDFRM